MSKVSVVIPILNEEDNINILYKELKRALEGIEYEIIFIDDGSIDRSFTILLELKKTDNRIKVIKFRRNFGQTAALSAGFDHAKGDIIVTMDGDLQNDPMDIPKLIQKIDKGYDIVCGWRKRRKDPFLKRRLPSILANRLISLVTKVKLHDYGCTLKAFKKDIVKNIKLYGEMHRFIPAIVSWMGVKITEVEVNHRARKYGRSKYGLSRTVRVILDLITVKFLLSYSTRPIQFFGLIGFLFSIIGIGIWIYLSFIRFILLVPIGGRPMLFFSLLLTFMGIQFITIGLLAEIQIRNYHESLNKPIYAIERIIE